MKVLVKITKEILERSMFCGIDKFTGLKLPNEESNIGRNCGIGNAICDLFPTAWVSNDCVWIFNKVPNYEMAMKQQSFIRIGLPKIAISFIYNFDISTPKERIKMKPFSFEIDVPNKVIDKIGIGEVYRVLSESRTLELVHP